jgi:lysophospholipase L1-like esterase
MAMLISGLWSVMIMVLPVRKWVSRLILPVIAILSFSAGVFAADTVKIMPLGDSITRGWYGSAYSWGYRKPLYVSLTNGGYNFDFVGGQTDGNFPDPQHEGHDGWQADNILPYLQGWLNTHRPDVVLLHIGTNDVTWNDWDANEVNDILNVIDNYEADSNKSVTVVLALIINRRIDSPSIKRAQTTQFNSDVNNMATNRIANGDDIIIVDMESALNYNIGVDMADEVHPNDAGYAKMAAVWYNALAGYFISRFDFTISGHVVELDGNTPVEGVLIQTDDNDISSVTDANGYYELLVNYGWSGVATPQKEGCVFEPNGYSYTDVNQDYNDMNYIATISAFKISGFVFEQDYVTPINDVNVSAENGGGSSLTNVNGYYEIWVDSNWSGKVKPSKYTYVFEPNSRYYEDVHQDYAADQNYTGNELDFRITGYIKNECDVPIEGVLVDANNGGDEDTTDVNGFYEVWVDSAWSGVVTPTKAHYTFDPNWMSYVAVPADQPDQNYVADNIYDLDCDGSISWGDVAVMAANWLGTGAGDIDNSGKVDFMDFAAFGLTW